MIVKADTETLGLCGPVVLYQYKEDNGDIVLHEPWLRPVKETLDLLERHCQGNVIFYNLVFDWFQLSKLNSMFAIIYEEYGNIIPITLPKEVLIDIEYRARDGKMLKPKGALDLYLHAQKGPFQHGMERESIKIRKVPAEIVQPLCDLLNKEFIFDPILFARKKEKGNSWKIFQFEDRKGNVVENFYNIICSFKPSLSLKAIAEHFGLVNKSVKFADLKSPEMPIELGFAPYAKSILSIQGNDWETVKNYLVRSTGTKKTLDKLDLPFKGTWVHYLQEHVDFWHSNETARKYATDDIVYLEAVYNIFDKPEFNDDDSVLACCVGAVRWKGFEINIDGMKALREEARAKITSCPIDYKKPRECHKYITEVMTDMEKAIIGKKTGKIVLETLEKSGSKAGIRAKQIMEARNAKKEIDLYTKLIIAERLHASYKIIGALSSRMSGADTSSPQQINRDEKVRSMFPMAPAGYKLCLGDFSGQEVTIFEAVSNDPKLREDLMSGKKIHGIFGTFVYPNMTYEEIVANKEIYTRSKSALFAMLYGGEAETLKERLGVPIAVARQAYDNFLNSYKGARSERLSIKDKFSPLRQDVNTKKVTWTECEMSVESLYGFHRYFSTEFYCCRVLFDLAGKLTQILKDDIFNETVVRNEEKGPQKIIGAAMSSLYATAFNIQSSVFRQAANHRIQSTGAQITKKLQRRFWDLQPVGSNELVVLPANCHDEVICPCKPELVETTGKIVYDFIKETQEKIPLLDMEWGMNLNTWADK